MGTALWALSFCVLGTLQLRAPIRKARIRIFLSDACGVEHSRVGFTSEVSVLAAVRGEGRAGPQREAGRPRERWTGAGTRGVSAAPRAQLLPRGGVCSLHQSVVKPGVGSLRQPDCRVSGRGRGRRLENRAAAGGGTFGTDGTSRCFTKSSTSLPECRSLQTQLQA